MFNLESINKWLNGKKMILGGVASGLTTVATFLGTLQDGFQWSDLNALGIGIAATLTILGVGGKFQKLIDALLALKK